MVLTLDSVTELFDQQFKLFAQQIEINGQDRKNRIIERIEALRFQRETGNSEQGNGNLVGVDSQEVCKI